MAVAGNYAIFMDKRWSLEDLYKFPRAYEQVYFAYEAILPTDEEFVEERIDRAFKAFPWRGGYSAVSFYNQLKWATPPNNRPTIQKIQYASPGFIELALSLPLAIKIAASVASVAGAIGTCNKVYNRIHVDLQNRKLLRLEVEKKKLDLTRDEIALISHANTEMAHLLGLSSPDAILTRTDNPLVSLKILLSIFRRVRILADYKNKGKADLAQRISVNEDGNFL
jgi:hypothetical protein